MKIVVDTNVLMNAIFRNSSNYWLYENIIEGNLELCVSTEILSEYAEIFGRYFGQEISENFLFSLLYSPFLIRTEAYYKWKLIHHDHDDDKFVDCAVASNADYIITHDKHFRVLEQIEFPKVSVMNPHDFKELFIGKE